MFSTKTPFQPQPLPSQRVITTNEPDTPFATTPPPTEDDNMMNEAIADLDLLQKQAGAEVTISPDVLGLWDRDGTAFVLNPIGAMIAETHGIAALMDEYNADQLLQHAEDIDDVDLVIADLWSRYGKAIANRYGISRGIWMTLFSTKTPLAEILAAIQPS